MALEWIDKIDGVDENSAGDVNALAAAIKDNEAAIAGKVDKVSGKGLTSNDYTDEDKSKLSGIEAEANKYEHPASHPASMITGLGDAASKNTGTTAGTVATGDHNHDDTYLKSETDPTVPAWAKSASKPTYTAAEVGADPAGTATGVQGNLDAHVGNIAMHVTSTEKSGWNSKLSQSNIKAGANVTVTTSGNDVTISSAGGGEPAPLINNLTTATAGQGALDAAQGKILNDTKANINHNHDGVYQPAGNYLTSEADPTVPAWAKAASKPAYTAAEVGAVPTTRKVNGKVLSADVTLSAADVDAISKNAQTITDWNTATASGVYYAAIGAANGPPINQTEDCYGYVVSADTDMYTQYVCGMYEGVWYERQNAPFGLGSWGKTDYVNRSGATMTGALKAMSNAAVGTAQMRNIYAGTADMTAGTTSLATGTIYLMYE